MRRGETSEIVKMPPAADGGSGTIKLTELSSPAGRPGRARKNLPRSLALIDPKLLTRQSILEMLAKALPDYETVAASSCEELLESGERSGGWPHLVIIHIRSAAVADAWVQNALELVRLRMDDALAIVLSDRDDVDDVVKALSCGVRGYIPTSVDSEVAFAALRLINAGGIFIPAHALRSATTMLDSGTEGERRCLPDELDLTPRELSVIDLLREGTPNKLIAAQLIMQESTVKVHVRNIMRKLRVTNRTHAASVANRLLGQGAPPTVALARPASD
jgi:DNA-binding NarL/FixJ family response regulator